MLTYVHLLHFIGKMLVSLSMQDTMSGKTMLYRKADMLLLVKYYDRKKVKPLVDLTIIHLVGSGGSEITKTNIEWQKLSAQIP